MCLKIRHHPEDSLSNKNECFIVPIPKLFRHQNHLHRWNTAASKRRRSTGLCRDGGVCHGWDCAGPLEHPADLKGRPVAADVLISSSCNWVHRTLYMSLLGLIQVKWGCSNIPSDSQTWQWESPIQSNDFPFKPLFTAGISRFAMFDCQMISYVRPSKPPLFSLNHHYCYLFLSFSLSLSLHCHPKVHLKNHLRFNKIMMILTTSINQKNLH